MRVFAVSGYSGTGKTTLIEALIRELTKRGYSVAIVKSTREEDIDTIGSDTWRHREAGAVATALLSSEAVVTRRYSPYKLEDVIRDWEYDFVLIEGMKDADLPKFWCVKDIPEEALSYADIKALVTASDSSAGWQDRDIEVLSTKDISVLADIVEREAVQI